MLVRWALAAVLSACLLACDSDDSPPTDRPTSTTVAGEALAYAWTPGETVTYQVTLDQHIVLSSEGETGEFAGEEVPSSADVTVTASGPFTFAVSEGPEPDAVSIAVTGQFDQTEVEGTVDGESVDDPAQIADLGVAQPVAASLVVDSRGRVLDQSSPGLGSTPLAGLSGDLGRLPGPVLSGEPVTVGSTWTETTPGTTFGGEPVETVTEAELTGSEDLDGVTTFVIKATDQTGAADIDLSEFFAQFMDAFSDDPDSSAPTDDIVFRITIDPSTSTSTTWFDPDAGLARRVTVTGEPTDFALEVALPNEDTGDLESYSMRLSVTQSLEYSLITP